MSLVAHPTTSLTKMMKNLLNRNLHLRHLLVIVLQVVQHQLVSVRVSRLRVIVQDIVRAHGPLFLDLPMVREFRALSKLLKILQARLRCRLKRKSLRST